MDKVCSLTIGNMRFQSSFYNELHDRVRSVEQIKALIGYAFVSEHPTQVNTSKYRVLGLHFVWRSATNQSLNPWAFLICGSSGYSPQLTKGINITRDISGPITQTQQELKRDIAATV